MPRPRSLPQRNVPAAPLDEPPEEHHLPALEVDPAAAIRISPIEITALGQTWTIPAMSAADWFDLVWAEDFTTLAVFPGLLGTEAEDLMFEAILDGEMTMAEVAEIGFEVLEAASGYNYWVTLRAITALKIGWVQAGGALVRSGVRATDVSLGAFLAAVLSWWAENMAPKKAVQFFDELNKRPDGVEPEIVEEDNSAAFLAAMHQSL